MAIPKTRKLKAFTMKTGGIDIQFLRIGQNDLIGFNEPASSASCKTFKVKLTNSTIAANSVFFNDIGMPHYAMTMGIGTIMVTKKTCWSQPALIKQKPLKR